MNRLLFKFNNLLVSHEEEQSAMHMLVVKWAKKFVLMKQWRVWHIFQILENQAYQLEDAVDNMDTKLLQFDNAIYFRALAGKDFIQEAQHSYANAVFGALVGKNFIKEIRLTYARYLFSVIKAQYAECEIFSDFLKIYEIELEKCGFRNVVVLFKSIVFQEVRYLRRMFYSII